MTTPTTMEERFEEKFCRIIKEDNVTEYILLEKNPLILEDFIQSEIDLAVEKREKEIVEEVLKIVYNNDPQTGYKVNPRYWGKTLRDDILSLITKK